MAAKKRGTAAPGSTGSAKTSGGTGSGQVTRGAVTESSVAQTTTRLVEWERRPFAKWPWIAGGVGAMTVFSGLHYNLTKSNVQDTLRAKAERALAKDFPGAEVRFHGRDAVISGVSVADRARAHDAVRHIEGVRNVKERALTAAAASDTTLGVDTTAAAPAVAADTAAETTVATPQTTQAPTTTAVPRTTAAPAATEPTTEPTTAAPAATEPTTEPTTEAPATTEPPATEPTTEAPATTEPTTEAPATTAAPATVSDAALGTGPILFAVSSADLDADATAAVDGLAKYLVENDGPVVHLTGHTDRTGTALANLSISSSRAIAVRDALIAKGVDRSRIHIRWVGARRPVASNGTAEGRRQNRRVDFRLVDAAPVARATVGEVSFTG